MRLIAMRKPDRTPRVALATLRQTMAMMVPQDRQDRAARAAIQARRDATTDRCGALGCNLPMGHAGPCQGPHIAGRVRR